MTKTARVKELEIYASKLVGEIDRLTTALSKEISLAKAKSAPTELSYEKAERVARARLGRKS